jgi:hypothetical protein
VRLARLRRPIIMFSLICGLCIMIYLSYYLLYFLFKKLGEEEGGTGFAWQWEEGEGGTNNVYTCE